MDCNPADGPPCAATEHTDVSARIFGTADECCGTLLGWLDLDECVADSKYGSPPLSGMWYVIWGYGDARCVNECDGPDANCGGKASDYKELYGTFKECCEIHTWYNTDCTANIPTPDSGGVQPAPPAFSYKYFPNFETASCLQDCEPGSAYGCAKAPSNAVPFDTIDACCSLGLSWADISYCASRSVGTYSDGWFADYALLRCGESEVP